MKNIVASERIEGTGNREQGIDGQVFTIPCNLFPVSSSGFTLLEILVATVILGTAVVALFGLLSGALGNLRRLRAPSQALMLAQGGMNQLLGAGLETGNGAAVAIPLDQKLEGRWDDQFRWEALATRFNPPPDTAPGQTIMVRIVLDVFWKSAPGKPEKKLSLETVQLQQEPQRANQ